MKLQKMLCLGLSCILLLLDDPDESLCYNPLLGRAGGQMNTEEMKARLRALLHQRDMLCFERDSLELFDLMEELDEEIHELEAQFRKSA